MKHLEHIISILVVFLLLTASAAWTGQLFGKKFTGQPETTFSRANTLPDNAILSDLSLSPEQISLEAIDSASWRVTDTKGGTLGLIVSTAPYAPDVQGFAGPTPLYIYITPEGTLKGLAAAANTETKDFFQKAFNELSAKWRGLSVNMATKVKPDAVSGATFSSRAIIENVNRTLIARAKAANTEKAAHTPLIGWGRTLAVALVLLIGGIIAWRFRGIKPLRLAVLVLNVCVLGFWCGQFLSISLLHGWIANGCDPMLYLPTLLVLAVAIFLPFIGRKRHYCMWVCPFGSLQELAGSLPVPKIPINGKAYRIMAKVRMGVLITLLSILYLGLGVDFAILDYEPFSAFLLTAATPAVLILAATFVILSLFVPKLWCKACCPLGCLLDLCEENLTSPSKAIPNNRPHNE